MESSSVEWLDALEEMLQEQMSLLFTTLVSNDGSPEHLQRITESCNRTVEWEAELASKRKRLTGERFAKADSRKSAVQPKMAFRKHRSKGKGYSTLKVLAATAKLAPYGIRAISHPSKMPMHDDLSAVMTMYSAATSPEAKLYIGGAVVMLGWHSTFITLPHKLAAELWQQYEQAGRPDIRIGPGLPCGLIITMYWYCFSAFKGELHASQPHDLLVHVIPLSEDPLLVKHIFFAVAFLENFWEPSYSARVAKWVSLAERLEARTGNAPTQVRCA
eukprot:scaffold169343_cov30-Prasinocladus_malaysianus.AAC.1